MLAHPGLELIALGSDSLAGRPAQALDPRLNGNAADVHAEPRGGGERRRRDLPLPRQRRRRPRSSRRTDAVVDRPRRRPPARRPGARRAAGTALDAGRLELRAARGASGRGPADREPRLLRDRDAARALARCATSSRATSIVDAKSGMTGAGRTLRDSSHAGAVLENFSPYAVGAHRHAPEIAQVLGFPVSLRAAPAAGAARPARDLLRAHRRGRPRARSRRRTPAAPSCACCRRGSSPRSGACREPTRPRSASSPTARPGWRS